MSPGWTEGLFAIANNEDAIRHLPPLQSVQGEIHIVLVVFH
jgi:hypothetical protein